VKINNNYVISKVKGNAQFIQFLIDNGADPKVRNSRVLYHCIEYIDSLELLLKHGVEINENVIYKVACIGNIIGLKYLLNSNKNISLKKYDK